MPKIKLDNLTKRYGNVEVLRGISLEMEDAEFTVLVGPSGCGKSTTLRMIAGLEDVSSGEIYIEGRPVSNLEPKERDLAMVFQDYALYPHMTLADRIVVVHAGRIQQQGSFEQLLKKPVNKFVAGFLGTPPMNFLTATVVQEGDTTYLQGQHLKLRCDESTMVRMVPPAVLLVPVFGLWNNEFCISKASWFGTWFREEFGGRGDICLAGTHSGIIVIYVALNLPFVIWILQSFVVQVPKQLEEAARMDGAGPFQIFFKVVLLLIKPGLAAAAIFTFRIAWNEYLLASALSDRDTNTVPILIENNMSEFNVEWGVIMATEMLLAIPPIIFTLFASRQIITGMTAGAVKG